LDTLKRRFFLELIIMPEPLDIMDPFEECPHRTGREILRRLGFEPLSPAQIDDFQIRGRLWELIYALAARRFYLNDTNHLTDRELYTWLHDDWLNHETCDIPPEAEWNCRISPNEATGDPKDEEIWLRFYADEEMRQKWTTDFPETEIPPHEDPPFDRDRWLPDAPIPPQPVDFDADEFLSLDEGLDEPISTTDEDDPLGLKAVDAELSQKEDRDEILAITGGEQPDGWQRPIEKLKQAGQPLLPPDELTDETLTAKLWELLHNLACQGFYVQHTDHLSDPQLYAELWQRGLRDEALLPGKCKTGGWFHDFLGSWGDEQMQIWLRYYASEEERARHQKEWPKDAIPPKEERPHNRDWRVPKGPFG
jgi:hypothetical protein